MKDEKLVVLREWNSVTEAEMAKSILDGAGIFSVSYTHLRAHET